MKLHIFDVDNTIIAGTLFRSIDRRKYGSGNTGAANSFRVLGWKAGAITTAFPVLAPFAYLLVAKLSWIAFDPRILRFFIRSFALTVLGVHKN